MENHKVTIDLGFVGFIGGCKLFVTGRLILTCRLLLEHRHNYFLQSLAMKIEINFSKLLIVI